MEPIVKQHIEKGATPNVIEYKGKGYTLNGTFFIKRTNDQEFIGEEMYKLFPEKVMTHQVIWTKKSIKEGNRNHFINLQACRAILINPGASLDKLVNYIHECNKCSCEVPLPKSEVTIICNNVYKNRKNIKLKPNKPRRIIFNDNYNLTTNEKRDIVNKELGKMKSDKTKQKIYIIIEDWDFETYGKINQKKVSELSGVGLRTVKRYWSEFKNYVKELNNEEYYGK